jgi:methylmalonyl-CoA/ethylmalonyl-CoA epimerase
MAHNVSLSRIRQIAIPVKEISEATRFYRDVLGMKHLFDAPPALSFFDCGGVQLMLSGPEAQGKEGKEQHPILYYDVTDIKAIHSRLKTAGAETIQEPHLIAKMNGREIWIAFVSDGQGNSVGLMSDVAAA